jgi:hypothetical protein
MIVVRECHGGHVFEAKPNTIFLLMSISARASSNQGKGKEEGRTQPLLPI